MFRKWICDEIGMMEILLLMMKIEFLHSRTFETSV